MPRSIIVSNETPNDQGGIVLNSSFDLSRFSNNPIMLYHHDWDKIIGRWENLRLEGGNWVADPVFSDIPEAASYKQLYEEGNLRSASIGALITWKTTGRTITNDWGEKKPETFITKEGYKVADKTLLYEISIVPIPSNPDAVTLSAKIYNEEELTILNSKYMSKEKEVKPTEETTEQAVKPVEEKPQETHVILQGLKDFFTELFAGQKVTLAPAHTEPDGDEPVGKGSLDTDTPQGAQLESDEKFEPEKGKDEAENGSEYCTKEAELPKVIKENLSSKMDKPELKTAQELEADKVKLAAAPDKPVVVFKGGASFSQLSADKDGKNILDRVMASGGRIKQTNDHAIVLNSVLEDPRFKAVAEKFAARLGEGGARMQLPEIASRLNSGNALVMNFKTGQMGNLTQLSSSDDVLASPDTLAVEFLSLFLFKLFPSTSWKSKIPIFGATEAGKNLGLIWTNIAADPAVYKGTKPSNPSNYEYADDAVSVKLIPFWLQPMLWTPLTMHMLRYDQMGTGWNQAMMKFNSYIDDQMIYTLADLIPDASKVFTNGGAFTIADANDINSFVLNPAFAGSLAKPVLNNIIQIEQRFLKQNYAEGTKFIVVMDPTMNSYIAQDPETKSLLTRWVDAQSGSEMLGFKNGEFATRSKVALYDPASGAIVDPAGVIPATAISAGMAFVPDQIGLAIGNLDVFMIQDPTNYGYKMSADIRMGATMLRKDGKGACLYTYGGPQN